MSGTLTLSPALVLGDLGYDAMGAAAVFLIAGLVFAQLALPGGAQILAASGLGYLRHSRRLHAQFEAGRRPWLQPRGR